MRTITWASIGCGNVCEVKSLPAMYKLPGSRVKGVFARNQDKAHDFAKRHGISTVYGSVEDLLNDAEVDIVYIATPPDTHKAYTLAALDAGKHVYVEKPMALNYAECLAMQAHAELKDRKLFVAHYRRALPYFKKVKQLLGEGAIGTIISVRLDFYKPYHPGDTAQNLPWRLQPEKAGGGYFFDLAPHGLDMVQFVMEDEITVASGSIANRGGFYQVEDTVVAGFKTALGVPGSAQWCFTAAPSSKKDTVNFIGTTGELECSVFEFTPIKLWRNGGLETFETERPVHIQEPLIKTILQDLRGEGHCPSTGKNALSTAWAMDRMTGKITG